MTKQSINLQDSFLNQVRKENTEVKVLLLDGTSLRGIIKGFDNFTIILHSSNSQHLIYKHAIAQMVNQRKPVRRQSTSAQPSQKEGFNKLDLSKVKVTE